MRGALCQIANKIFALMTLLTKGILLSIFVLNITACGTKPGDGAISAGEFSKRHLVAEDYVAEIDSIRSVLAGGIGDVAVDAQTFAEVCKPVAHRARELSEQTGWDIKQVATKYRNPAHKADEQAWLVIQRFEEFPELQDVWERIPVGEETGWRFFAPIRVEASCLACHGEKDSRPAFIKEGYPEDLAFDFEEGDLRGLYSVFVPDSIKAQ